MLMKTIVKKISTVYKGRTFQVNHRLVKFENENKFIDFEIIERQSVALVIPIFSNGDLLMIEQYRSAIDEVILEFPGGKIEEDETIFEAAQRELEEETGYHSSKIVLINDFYSAPHFSNERIYLFIAQNLVKTKSDLQEKEFIQTKSMTVEDMKNILNENILIDSKTIVACFSLLNFLDNDKKK